MSRGCLSPHGTVVAAEVMYVRGRVIVDKPSIIYLELSCQICGFSQVLNGQSWGVS